MTNSRQKGARGERAAADYLTSLGFPCKRMGRNGYSDCDLKGVEEHLPNLHIEIKFGVQGMDIGTALLERAFDQAGSAIEPCDYEVGSGSEIDTRTPVVLWKPMRKPWRLTWSAGGFLVTTCGDEAIKWWLRELNG